MAAVPPEVEWFKNLDNEHTNRAYKRAIQDFMLFAGIDRAEFRLVTRSHVIAWRDQLTKQTTRNAKKLGKATVRHRLTALLEKTIFGDHVLITSDFLLQEVAWVLAYPRIEKRWYDRD